MFADELDYETNLVLNAIKEKPKGSSFDYLYDKTNLEKKDISLALQKLTQLLIIYKSGTEYILTDAPRDEEEEVVDKSNTKIDSVVNDLLSIGNELGSASSLTLTAERVDTFREAASILRSGTEQQTNSAPSANLSSVVKAMATAPVVNSESKQELVKVYGSFSRGGLFGKLAYFFYSHRKENNAYSAQNLQKLLPKLVANQQSFNQTIYQLAAAGVITSINPEDKNKFYKWSNKLIYPFSKVLANDVTLLSDYVESKPKLDFDKLTNSFNELHPNGVVVNPVNGTIKQTNEEIASTVEAIVDDVVGKVDGVEFNKPLVDFITSENYSGDVKIETITDPNKITLSHPFTCDVKTGYAIGKEIQGKAAATTSSAMDALDAHIRFLEGELASLKSIRSLM